MWGGTIDSAERLPLDTLQLNMVVRAYVRYVRLKYVIVIITDIVLYYIIYGLMQKKRTCTYTHVHMYTYTRINI